MGVNTPEKAAPTFGEALVREVKAEMGRNDIRSVRALAELLGDNHVYWNDRLNRPGSRVPINMDDLPRLSEVLHVTPWELVRRADVARRPQSPSEGRDVG